MSENEKDIEELQAPDAAEEKAPESSAPSQEPAAPEKSTAKKSAPRKEKAPAPSAPDGSARSKAPMSRKMKRGLVSGTMTVLVLVAVVLVNVFASMMTGKLSALTVDITGMKNFEISDTTRDVVGGLKRAVTISFLSDRDSYVGIDPYCKQTAILAEEMERASDGMITVNYVDIVRNPSFVEDYPDDDLNTTDIIVSSGTNRKILKVADMFTFETYTGNYSYITASKAEQELDNAMISVSSGELINVAVIIDSAGDDRTYFENTLRADGYSVTEVNLNGGDLPEGTQMAVLYTPTQDLTAKSVSKIKEFLRTGDKTLLYIASPTDTGVLENIEDLIFEYGLSIEQGFTFEADGSRVNSSSSNFFDGVLCSYASELYTNNISDLSRPVIAGYARPVIPENTNIAEPLLKYSEYSGMCPFDADESWSYIDSMVGDVPILAQGTRSDDGKISSVIVSGSDRIFSRSYYGSDYSNKAYISTMLATVNGRTADLVTVPEKVITSYDITVDRQTATNLGFIVYALIPLIILGAGFTVFLMRRNR